MIQHLIIYTKDQPRTQPMIQPTIQAMHVAPVKVAIPWQPKHSREQRKAKRYGKYCRNYIQQSNEGATYLSIVCTSKGPYTNEKVFKDGTTENITGIKTYGLVPQRNVL